MKDSKTTIASIIQAVIAVLGIFGYALSPENKEAIVEAGIGLYVAVGIVKGLFTKDATSAS